MVTNIILAAVVLVLLGAALFIFDKFFYVKAKPNEVLIITGPRGSKEIIGKSSIVIPIIQRVDRLSLENIQSDFTSKSEIPTKDAINIKVDAVANVSVSKEPELLKIAASKFIGYTPDMIKEVITPILEGNIREIISQITLKELIQGDKKILVEKISLNVEPNLRDLGLELIAFTIQNFKDDRGVIDNLGIENTVQISKDAAISKANAEKEIAMAQAEASRLANEAEVVAKLEMAQRNNELAIKEAELKRVEESKRAEADAAYEITKLEQRKTIEINAQNANLAKSQKEIELKQTETQIAEGELNASVRKKAEAAKFAEQQKADAEAYARQKKAESEQYERQRKAEADKFEAEQLAEAEKARSEAQRIAMENEAAGIEAKGKAEAEAVKAKLVAEAEGMREKAEAMKEYGEQAVTQMQLDTLKEYFKTMPAVASAVAEPMKNIDSITMYGEGNTAKMTKDITNIMNQVTNGVKDSTGIDLTALFSGWLGSKIGNNE